MIEAQISEIANHLYMAERTRQQIRPPSAQFTGMTMGILAMAHPEAAAAIDGALGRIIAAGKPAGTITGGAVPTQRLLARGCSFVAAGVDVVLLAKTADELAAVLHQPCAP